MPSISTWIVLVLVAENSTSRSTTKAWQARAVTVAPTQLAAIYASAPQAANPIAANRGVPYLLSARVSWPIVSIPDMGDGVSRRGADPSAQLRAARAGWPAARRMTVGHPRVVAGTARHQGGVGGGPTRERKSGVKNLPS